MLAPEFHWCHQISVTSMCSPKTPDGKLTGCSNCTRLLQHEQKRYFMSPEQFEQCAEVAKDFTTSSKPCPQGRRKVIGVFGGDPLLSPWFPDYVDIICSKIPDSWNRGLWCSLDFHVYKHPKYGAALPHVMKLLGHPNGAVYDSERTSQRSGGYLNFNRHDDFDPNRHQSLCQHQPVLVAIKDVVKDEKRKWELISKCWIPEQWSAAYGLDHNGEPKFWWCEIASGHDRVFNLGVGLPVEKDCWRGDLWFENDENGVPQPKGKFAHQILATCTGCGAALPLPGRRDLEYRDDISPSNVAALQAAGSPMVARGDYVEFGLQQIEQYSEAGVPGWNPQRYLKGKG